MNRIAIDAGPLVALLDKRDEYHEWARDLFGEIEPPLITNEAVISEACFLVGRVRGDSDAVMALIERGVIEPSFRLAQELAEVRKLMARYSSVPMSVADACLVRAAELESGLSIMTLDSDFRTYRKNGRQIIPLLSPPVARRASR